MTEESASGDSKETTASATLTRTSLPLHDGGERFWRLEGDYGLGDVDTNHLAIGQAAENRVLIDGGEAEDPG
uniref:MBL fold metallo-hydrolase n=1 Tax=Steinernema glaseri TaxID=37863 RepID=A0A1I7YQD5_9BILA